MDTRGNLVPTMEEKERSGDLTIQKACADKDTRGARCQFIPNTRERKTSDDLLISTKADLKYIAERTKSRTDESNEFRHTMLRVCPGLKRVYPRMYTPEHISLGLFDRLNFPETRADKTRLMMANIFLETTGRGGEGEGAWETLCELVVEDPLKMRDLYDAEPHDNLSLDAVRCVLTLDAIFVTCVLRIISMKLGRSKGLQHSERCGDSQNYDIIGKFRHSLELGGIGFESHIFHDIMKMENQVPLPLIKKVLEILYPNSAEAQSAMKLICVAVACVDAQFCIPGINYLNHKQSVSGMDDLEASHHLLHCMYKGMWANHKDEKDASQRFCSSRTEYLPSGLRKSLNYICKSLLKFFVPKRRANEATCDPPSLPSATLLRQAGIQFRGQEGCFSDVKFTPGPLRAELIIPSFSINDSTHQMWRNLIAFEETHCPKETLNSVNKECTRKGEFIALLSIMDELIDSERDVFILKGSNSPVIIRSDLGNDKAVAALFNGIGTNVTIDSSEKWNTLRIDINAFYNQKFRKIYVEFMETYFSKPWITMGVVVAIIVTILQLIQTIHLVSIYYN